MLVMGHGVDLTDIARIERMLADHGDRFRERVFTALERAYADAGGSRAAERYAARFAAKEAVMKALGTGVRGVGWREIEILVNARGKPQVLLHGKARARAHQIGMRGAEISLTHDGDLACAFVVGGPAADTDQIDERGPV